jgi:uncharacterized membrane protein YwaF
MTYYVVYIFAMAGLKGNINLISSGVQYALFIIFSTVMFFFVDKIGRRTLLVWGAVAMGFCHFVVGGVLGAHYTYVPGMNHGNPLGELFANSTQVVWMATKMSSC